jgi:hypothetical protein
VAVWAAAVTLGCASSPPQARSADLIMPEWVSGNPPPAPARSKATTRFEQKPGLIYGDPRKGRAPRQRATKSPFTPNSSNSRFYGGSGCIETPGHKCR